MVVKSLSCLTRSWRGIQAATRAAASPASTGARGFRAFCGGSKTQGGGGGRGEGRASEEGALAGVAIKSLIVRGSRTSSSSAVAAAVLRVPVWEVVVDGAAVEAAVSAANADIDDEEATHATALVLDATDDLTSRLALVASHPMRRPGSPRVFETPEREIPREGYRSQAAGSL